jgi:hypothetical protein
MRNYYNTTDRFSTSQEVLDFLKKMFDELPEGMIMDYVAIDRPYDDPAKFHVEFSSRTPHPDFDTIPTNEEIQ